MKQNGWSSATCPYEALLFAGNILTFLETSVGSSAKSLETCSLTEQDGPALAFRLCVGNTSLAKWQEPVLNNCTPDVNDQLDSLKNKTVTKDNVEKVAELLISLTENISSIDEAALSSTADVLDNIINIRDSSPEVTSDVVNVVNNLLQADKKDSGEPADDSSSRIIQALDSQISHVLANGANFSKVTSSLAVKALSASPSSVAGGVGLVCMKGTTGEDPLTEGRVSVYYSESAIPMDKVEASISLPGEVLMNFVSEGGAVPISFILYQNTKLFRSKKIAKAMEDASRNLSIASSVISATVINSTIDDLPSKTPVSSTFAPHNWQKQINQKSDKIKESLSCVFWDFRLEDGIGDWSTAGCKQARSGDGRTACHCNHATSFAVLVDIHGQYSSLALDLISKIGCGVSIVSLVVTIVVYLAVKKFRKKTASHILIWFCLSLLCLYAVFLFGIEQTSSRVVCIVMAVLMHYFALTSVFWMGVEATNLYLKLIRVFRADVKHFMIKAFVVAWGLPMIVVGVILGVDYTVYENTTSCFLKPGNAFYYGQLLIIGLVLLFNVTIFVLVIRQLTCKADKSVCFTVRSRRSKVARRLQNMVSISILLGLTWIFGLFSVVESTNFIFQILFCAFNSLQGLFIFLLFVVRQGYLTRRRNEYRLDISTSKRKFQLEVPENALSIPDVEGNNETTVTEELGMSLISETVEEEGGFSRGTVTSFTNGGVTDEVEGEGSGEGAKTVRKEDRVSDDAVMSTTSPKEGDNDTTEGGGIKESAPLITL
ncbi:adhesion G-protein coupled receptor G2-like [Acanthaster planci]|uniref:Adhesion G-protein coupled receptor G2-like n=1 Tax=Acanthaster planci TaxID=133434 RepID=A0A8B7Z3S6_ACAPL|nr:adhesion G-protein coupled receptor G2-like [Acanthaster planci]